MRVYLAGPMTGYPHHNFPAFEEMARRLRAETHHEVVSPRELGPATVEEARAMPWAAHMRRDIRALLECDAVALLPAWRRSRGAALEVSTALGVGIPVYYAEDLLAEVNGGGPATALAETALWRRTGPDPEDREPDFVAAAATPEEHRAGNRDRVADPVTGAVKDDARKPRTDLLPVAPLMDTAEVFAFGARKYADRNWERGFAWSRPYGALLRHLFQWWGGQDDDEETGLSHLAHAACCLMMLQEYRHSLAGTDDRPYREGDHD